ncbi:group II intron reverse transcriptase/maturase, partial [Salmonella enterica subsp. diarizonae]|nr:group II intron reverse transcriptase/maturase [Salmonella enterica subsp. diarizonae]
MIISKMQRKLATWAATDPSRRMERLLRLITQPEWLAEAARITLSSKGACTPGIDGVSKANLQASLPAELQRLSEELLSGHYQPLPARRIYIPKSNGKQRPLGIPALRDRIVQRAMLMAMEPIWESDFHTLSYGFRPERSVHHAIRTVKLQLTGCGETRGRWVIEGDLSSYFDTVHHRLLMKAVRRRIRDPRFMALLWKIIKAGHVDAGLFRAASEGVPQGGVLSPLLSNVMLNEFDQYLHERYLSGKARKDRWYWNNSIQRGRSTAVRENWQWKPAVAYCRYADDFVLIVKGTKSQAEAIREECRSVLEDSLKLRLNMDKTRITHVNDGFIFLGHRIIRKRSRYGGMRVVTTIPRDKARNFAASLTTLLSGNYSESKIDMVEILNRKLKGWAVFYQFVDFKAKVFSYIDRVVFWKLAHWLARKYRKGIAYLMRWWCKSPKPG